MAQMSATNPVWGFFFVQFAKTRFITRISIVLYASIEFCLSVVPFQDIPPNLFQISPQSFHFCLHGYISLSFLTHSVSQRCIKWS